MIKFSGNIKKMKSEFLDPIKYQLPINNELIPISDFIDKTIAFNFNGIINCVLCNREINKTFFQGYCYPCFINSPQTSECILKPELCQAHHGIARDMKWAENHCLQEHYVYLALTAGSKVGVTRSSQIPTRWIDQGAVQAIKFAKTTNRYEAGALEVQLKGHLSDRTAWQRMLKNDIDYSINLLDLKNKLKNNIDEELSMYISENNNITKINYPLIISLEKIKSINFLKKNSYEGTLIGIKGQYLLFSDNNVINIRKHSGFNLTISINQ